MQEDLVSIRNQITKLILRYGHRYRDGQAWTGRFWVWLRKIELSGYSQTVLEEMHHHARASFRAACALRLGDRARIEASPNTHPTWPALSVLRGINTLSAMTLLSELGDLRRFPTAPQLMAAVGLVPSEYSTGDKTSRFSITKTGNAHVRHIVVEAAWHYQRRITNGARIKARRKGQPQALVDIAEKCDLRLHRKFIRMTSRGKRSTVAAVAVARELVGFIWAIGQELELHLTLTLAAAQPAEGPVLERRTLDTGYF